jgi:hypothetical protein
MAPLTIKTGDQFHLDGTLNAYRVLLSEGGLSEDVGGGVSGFFYQQITGDSGSGAKLGSFEAMTTGVGPDLAYIYRNKNVGFAVVGEVKWLPELSVSNKLQGNIVWFKLAFSWGPPSPSKPAVETFAAPEAAVAPQAPAAPNVRALCSIPSL